MSTLFTLSSNRAPASRTRRAGPAEAQVPQNEPHTQFFCARLRRTILPRTTPLPIAFFSSAPLGQNFRSGGLNPPGARNPPSTCHPPSSTLPLSRLQSSAFSLQHFSRRAGFTIIELLAVITLIAMLIALVFGAAQYVIRTARDQQAHSTASAMQVAITTYRHEYGKWPVDVAVANGVNPTNGDGNVITIPGSQNWMVFDMLRSSSGGTLNPDNTNNVSFIDNSTVLAETSQDPLHSGQCIRRYQLPSSGGMIEQKHAVVYVPRDGGLGYYSITIWFDLEKVEVDM